MERSTRTRDRGASARRRPHPARPAGGADPDRLAPARGRVGADLTLGLAALGVFATGSCLALGLPASHPLAACALWGGLALLVGRTAPGSLPGAGLGAANRITLGRAVLAVAVAALLAVPPPLSAAARWWGVVVGAAALALDGLDGRVARRTGTSSAFGARFDMEVDAFLILALSAIAWTSTSLGAWVLGIGAMRYAFVAAGALHPPLAGPLPPSRRRQAICVLQSVALLAAIAPPVPDPARLALAVAALLTLAWSFAVDVAWLLGAGAVGPRAARGGTPLDAAPREP